MKGVRVMERRLFKKTDIIVLVILVALALLFFFSLSKEEGETVEIWLGGKLAETYLIDEPFEILLENGVVIKCDGSSAWFEHSDCPDKVCVNTGKLSVSGEWAACLPNETVIKITKGNGDVDTVS